MITTEEVEEFLNKVNGLNAVVIGDVMLDRYLYGRVQRVSPEAPVPILDYTHTDEKPGGAGNVALNLKEVGVEVDLIGLVGADEEAEKFAHIIEDRGISSASLYTDTERVTTLKTRALSGQQHLLRVDREQTDPLSPQALKHFLKKVQKILSRRDPDIIILQDYNKGTFTADVLAELLPLLKETNAYISVDPKVENFWKYAGVNLIKPNLRELSAALGRNIQPDLIELRKAAKEIESKLYNNRSVFTLSEHGIYIHNGVDHILKPTEAKEIVDVCGAGDAVISTVTLASALEMDRNFTAEISNLAGKIVCEQIGVVPITVKQIRKELH